MMQEKVSRQVEMSRMAPLLKGLGVGFGLSTWRQTRPLHSEPSSCCRLMFGVLAVVAFAVLVCETRQSGEQEFRRSAKFYQNMIFSPNCSCLGEFACELMMPKLVFVTVVFGPLN
jgi:hypothetical protein